MSIPPEIQQRVQRWLNGPYDSQTKQEIQTLLDHNPQILCEAFYSELSFGTGGLRGLMGIGTNRLNTYTIHYATQGLVNYILKQKIHDPLVVIGFDSRHHSEEFAWETARVCAGNGVRVKLLNHLRPTPFISFACRQEKATAAVMITASHNPKDYNGYKVYWSDGAQVVPPHDTGIMAEVGQITDPSQVKRAPANSPLIEVLDNKLDKAYLEAIYSLQHFPTENREEGQTLKIIYTPLHGTGITLTPLALANWGFQSVQCVPEQSKPDGDFPTVKFPNPEYKEALQLGIHLLEKTQSDILIANDPDADRIGTAILYQGQPVLINGNEMAAICTYYLCKVLTEQKKMPSRGAFVTTIVSTELIREIASSFNKPCIEVLTGFKYIGEKIHEWEQSNNGYQFIFGAEESYGYLVGTHARDKDAVVMSCLIAEIALHTKRQGHTLLNLLHEVYQRYGVYREKQVSLDFQPTQQEFERMHQLMKRLRLAPPKQIAGIDVVKIEDYLSGQMSLPQSDVLTLRLQDKSRLIIRPSGTEPKIKIYASTCQPATGSLDRVIQSCDQHLSTLIDSLKEHLK